MRWLSLLWLAACAPDAFLPEGAVVRDADGDGFAATVDCNDDDANVGAATPWYEDADSDLWGATSTEVFACDAPQGTVATGGDCADGDDTSHPAATERCDEVDHDCDGSTTDVPAELQRLWFRDADGDGFGSDVISLRACFRPTGFSDNGDDCDDQNALVSPVQTEVCDDGIDNDCRPNPGECVWVTGDLGEIGDRASALLGTAGGQTLGDRIVATGDIDGDGLDDVAVASPNHVLQEVSQGSVYILGAPGRPSGSLDARAIVGGSRANGRLGDSLAALGDVDDDGFADLLVGEPGAQSGNEGRAFLLLGPIRSAAAVTDRAAAIFVMAAGSGSSVAGPDMDGDGVAELAIGTPGRDGDDGANLGAVVLHSADVRGVHDEYDGQLAIIGPQAGAMLGGRGVFAPGDLDDDGFDELVIPWAAGNVIYVITGWGAEGPPRNDFVIDDPPTGVEILTIHGAADGSALGEAVLGADLDGNGVPELVVTDPSVTAITGDSAGSTFVIPDGTAWPGGPQILAAFALDGVAGTNAGDALAAGVHPDTGAAWLAVGASRTTSFAGAVHVQTIDPAWFSSPYAAYPLADADAVFTESGEVGAALATADLDGDGLQDLVIGAPIQNGGRGAAYVVWGIGQ